MTTEKPTTLPSDQSTVPEAQTLALVAHFEA